MAVLNGGDLVVRAIESVLAQDHPDVEIVVVDDCSADGTAENLGRRFGSSLTVHRNARRLGQGATVNRAVGLSSSPLIKFLDHDDVLDPTCLSRLATALDGHPPAGLAFCRRRLELDRMEGRPIPEDVHKGFADLRPVNAGEALLRQLVANELRSNWIGEPVCVMARRDAIESAGGFSTRTRHYTDFDLWVRILTAYDAVFVDEELATYRRSPDSLSERNALSGDDWLDRLWILEGLCARPGMTERYPSIVRLRNDERRIAARTAARGVLRREPRVPLARWFEYLRYRLT